jgi:hypothetical protein
VEEGEFSPIVSTILDILLACWKNFFPTVRQQSVLLMELLTNQGTTIFQPNFSASLKHTFLQNLLLDFSKTVTAHHALQETSSGAQPSKLISTLVEYSVRDILRFLDSLGTQNTLKVHFSNRHFEPSVLVLLSLGRELFSNSPTETIVQLQFHYFQVQASCFGVDCNRS